MVTFDNQCQGDLMPEEAGARNVTEESDRGLEHNGIRAGYDSTGGLCIRPTACQLYDMKAHQTDFDYLTYVSMESVISD